MSKPTIGNMLDWVESAYAPISPDKNVEMHAAIRATLIDYLETRDSPLYQDIAIEIIRSFVARAQKHVEPLLGQANYYGHFYIAIKESLAELEEEARTK